MSKPVLIINGPNLNMLGEREPEIYGHETLKDVEYACAAHAKGLGLSVSCLQSNVEGELVNFIQKAKNEASAVIINAGAYTHTSVALLDALSLLSMPIIEVHISNLYQREEFRHHSFISQAADGMICGLGTHGYLLALDAVKKKLS